MSAYPRAKIIDLMRRERLPESFEATVRKYYAPLAADFAKRKTKLARTMIVGVNGPQGSGKSTLAQFLALLLSSAYDMRVAVLSIDDFYLTKAERQKLAEDVHPLLATRGAPGTHDVELGCSVMMSLVNAKPNDVTRIPRFDKLNDDRRPKDQWELYKGAPDIIIFEGWCVGVRPQPDGLLTEPVNDLERLEDASGVWRRLVNNAIADDYPALFDLIDMLVYLKPPDFECVYNWRGRQEERLSEATSEPGVHAMGERELQRFIMHYERLTRFMMEDLPGHADVVINIDEAQQVVGVV